MDLNQDSFASLIKNELIKKKMSKTEINAFIDGMLYVNFVKADQEISISFRNQNLFREFLFILKESNYSYWINGSKIYFRNLKSLNFIKSQTASAFLAGAFLISGSISKLNSSSYHLQMSLKNQANLENLINFVAKHIQFSQATNKNQFIMYLKRHEAISDFLYIIGAQNCYFQFLEAVIERDHRNQITRISNLDIHNQSRLVESNQIFLEQFNFIHENKLEKKFTKEQIIFYKFKKDHPYLPLSQIVEELAKKYQIIKTKSGINHWLIKLRNVCEEFKKNKNKL